MSIEGKRSHKAPEEESGDTRMSRRDVLAGALGATAALAGGYKLNDYLGKHPGGEDKESAERSPEVICDFAEVGLTGKQCSGLAAQYFDLPSGAIFPAQARVNFQASLKDMWDIKLRKTKEVAPQRLPRMQRLADDLLGSYRDAWNVGQEGGGIEDFTGFINKLAEIERTALFAMDWSGVAREYGISDEWSLGMAKHLVAREHGRSLGAYTLKEITPSGGRHSLDAIRELDTVLRFGGVEYANRIPAMGDARPSFGFGQLTDLADEDNIAKEHEIRVSAGDPLVLKYPRAGPAHRGKHHREDPRIKASLNDFLPAHLQVPKTMWEFRTMQDHATGMLLLGLDGMVRAVKTLEDGDASDERIRRVAGMDGPTFASVLAAHHYRPAIAHRALIDWSKDENWANDGSAHEPYHQFCADKDPLVGSYSSDSFDNYAAIDMYFGVTPEERKFVDIDFK